MSEGPARTRLEPDERREQILLCAVRLFGERPYAAVSTTELANAAGVTRGLLHHYFGTKRGLYIEVVRRMVQLPGRDVQEFPGADMKERIDASVDWVLDSVGRASRTFVAVVGAEGVGHDPEIEQILADADDTAARRVLEGLGIATSTEATGRQRALIRAYGGMVKAAVREWVAGALSREEVAALLSNALLAIVEKVIPETADDVR
jgi:AcrR family transcriptional regulator